MLVFALLLGGMWVAMSLSFVVTGVVFAADLTLLVPGLLAGGLLLWRRHPWGFVLGAIMLIKGSAYGPALLAMSAFAASAGSGSDPFLLLWVVLTAWLFDSTFHRANV
jgi:hypothetical protein